MSAVTSAYQFQTCLNQPHADAFYIVKTEESNNTHFIELRECNINTTPTKEAFTKIWDDGRGVMYFERVLLIHEKWKSQITWTSVTVQTNLGYAYLPFGIPTYIPEDTYKVWKASAIRDAVLPSAPPVQTAVATQTAAQPSTVTIMVQPNAATATATQSSAATATTQPVATTTIAQPNVPYHPPVALPRVTPNPKVDSCCEIL